MFSQLFKRKQEKEPEEKIKEKASRGQKLSVIVNSAEWAEILLVKEYMQENAGMVAVSLGISDHQRHEAAVQFSTIEVFFKEISQRIKDGEKASKELQQLGRKDSQQGATGATSA